MAESSKAASDNGAYTNVDALLKLRFLAKDIKLQTRKKSGALMDGESRSNYRGRGMEFAEVRPYQAGDDIRNIDWRVTARTQQTYTKLFQEERERPVYLVVDQRSPMFFGSRVQFKSVSAAKLAALIAWAALHNNDRLGALIFSDSAQTDTRARRGKHAVLATLHQLHQYNSQLRAPFANAEKNALYDMLTDVRRVAKPGSAIFLLSDFHDFDARCHEPLALLARHCEITALHIVDPLEKNLPAGSALLSVTNGRDKCVFSGGELRGAYQQSFAALQAAVRKQCQHSGIGFVEISTDTAIATIAQEVFASNKTARARSSGGLQR